MRLLRCGGAGYTDRPREFSTIHRSAYERRNRRGALAGETGDRLHFIRLAASRVTLAPCKPISERENIDVERPSRRIEATDAEDVLALLRYEFAAATLETKLRHLASEQKFDRNQARVPAGSGRTSGRFADEGRHGGGRSGDSTRSTSVEAAKRLSAVAVANPELAAGAAAAAAMPAAAAYVGVSRAVGLADHAITGRPITPFLHIPYDPPETVIEMARRAGARVPRAKLGRAGLVERDKDCEDLYRDDERQCFASARKYDNKRGYSKAVIEAVCLQQARIRLQECRKGGLGAVRSPLFSGGDR